MKPPVLFGRRMRTRMRAHGVTVWESRYGRVSCSIAHDPHNRLPYHWQIDAWTKLGCLSGDARTLEQALDAVARPILQMAKGLPREVVT